MFEFGLFESDIRFFSYCPAHKRNLKYTVEISKTTYYNCENKKYLNKFIKNYSLLK
jgi:DNA-binding XRE family transcriptional regulator